MNEWEVDTAHTSPQHVEAGGWVAMVINPSLSDPLPSLLSLASEGKVKAVQ